MHTSRRSLAAHIPLYLYPFLSTVHKGKPFEYLRLTSLGVLGALVKVSVGPPSSLCFSVYCNSPRLLFHSYTQQDDPAVVEFLLKTEIVPLCLRIMDNGTELSRTVATFIMQKIMQDERGLNFVCASTDRFRVVNTVLSNMVGTLEEAPSPRLLKHVLRCYSRLADHKVCVRGWGRRREGGARMGLSLSFPDSCSAREALRTGLPSGLRRGKLHDLLMSDATLARWLRDLLQAAGEG